VTGLITLDHIRRLPRDDWARRTAATVATPLSEVAVARPDEPLVDVLERMAGRRDGRALVFERDTWDQPVLVGIVSPSDVNRAVQTAAVRSGGLVASDAADVR
jgi:CBS domain-containing protein